MGRNVAFERNEDRVPKYLLIPVAAADARSPHRGVMDDAG